MTYLLNIDTTQETAHLRLTRNGELVEAVSNHSQKDHASWIHPAIQSLLSKHGLSPKELQAVGVAEGPGSYTGLRVGMATAKGICFTAEIPLITLNTLEIMAGSLKNHQPDLPENILLCPMIDARRMEVFTAVYNLQLELVLQPQAMILSSESFASIQQKGPMIFCGSGTKKWQENFPQPNCHYVLETLPPEHMDQATYQKYVNKSWADLAYSEPVYLKEFYTHPS